MFSSVEASPPMVFGNALCRETPIYAHILEALAFTFSIEYNKLEDEQYAQNERTLRAKNMKIIDISEGNSLYGDVSISDLLSKLNLHRERRILLKSQVTIFSVCSGIGTWTIHPVQYIHICAVENGEIPSPHHNQSLRSGLRLNLPFMRSSNAQGTGSCDGNALHTFFAKIKTSIACQLR